MVNTEDGLVSCMDMGAGTKFLNPANDEVVNYLLGILEDLAAYDVKGIILDRCRYDDFDLQSDFSEVSRRKFEEYIGKTVSKWPDDVFKPGATKINSPITAMQRSWMEFRAKNIHDFMEKASNKVHSVNPDIRFGAYVGAWYSSYYNSGVNWASPSYNAGNAYNWATAEYNKYGYADHCDIMLIGAYASTKSIYGTGEWTMQGFCSQAMAKTKNAGGHPALLVGGPDVGNWDSSNKYTQEQENQAITNSVKACGDACDGYFLFDMIHLKKAAEKGIDQWGCAKAGIDQLNPKN